MASTSRVTRQNRLRLILSGIQKHLSGATTLALGGQTEALADLTKRIQADIDASDAFEQAKAELAEAVQAENASHEALDPLLRLLKLSVIAQFGDTANASATLADFGYSPRKTGIKSLATKTEAAEKAKATREARHTLGPKARLLVKGIVPSPDAADGSQPTPAPVNGSASSPVAPPKAPS